MNLYTYILALHILALGSLFFWISGYYLIVNSYRPLIKNEKLVRFFGVLCLILGCVGSAYIVMQGILSR